MTTRAFYALAVGAVMLAMIGTPAAVHSQDAPIPKSPVTLPPPAPSTAPTAAPMPPDSAVALCMDGSWIKTPRTAADCTARGGLRVAMPPKAEPLPAPVAASAASRNIIAAPRTTLNAGIPAGATMQCKDGSFLFGSPSESRCSQNGGVAAFFPAALPPPPPPRRP
jgi:hypothetical protein